MERTSSAAPVPAQPFQFTIRSLLWLMITLGMVLAFVRLADARLLVLALASGACGMVLAAIAGWKAGRVYESAYWALLSMLLAVICLVGQPYVTLRQMAAWPVFGVVVGSLVGAIPPGRWKQKVPLAVTFGCAVMQLFFFWDLRLEDVGDVVLAAVVAGVLAILSEIFAWARARYRTSYGAWAAALVVAVILGNWGANWLTPLVTGWFAG